MDEGTLLESLGYASLDAFRAAHPQNKRSCGPSVERIYNPVPPEVMLESILYYYGGARISSVCRMMGYTQTVTPEVIRHRVYSWKKKHPALAAGMPRKRPKPKKETEAMKMTYDEAGLPPTPTQGAATPTTSSASCAGSAPCSVWWSKRLWTH